MKPEDNQNYNFKYFFTNLLSTCTKFLTFIGIIKPTNQIKINIVFILILYDCNI